MDGTQEFLEAVMRGDVQETTARLAVDPELARAAGAHDKTGLHWAAERDHVEVARVLLAAGADLEARTSWGESPLEWAATMGSGRVAELLLERGATGLTLVQAAALGKLAVVEAFLASGVSGAAHARRLAPAPADQWPPDTAHARGDVLSDALYAAARNGHDEVVKVLLDRGAEVDAKGFFGATGLMWAAVNGHASTVRLLLARGADTELRDAHFDGDALGWAREGGSQEIELLIQEARGQRGMPSAGA